MSLSVICIVFRRENMPRVPKRKAPASKSVGTKKKGKVKFLNMN